MAPDVLALLWAAFTAVVVYSASATRSSARRGESQGCVLALGFGVVAPVIALMWRESTPAWAWWTTALAAVGGGAAATRHLIDATDQRVAWLAQHELVDAEVFFSEVRYVDGLPRVGRGSGDVRSKDATLYVTAFSAPAPKGRQRAEQAPPPTAVPLVRIEEVEGVEGDAWGFSLAIRWRTTDGMLRTLQLHVTGAYNVRARDAARRLTQLADEARAAAHTAAGVHTPAPAIPATSGLLRAGAKSQDRARDDVLTETGAPMTDDLTLFISHAVADAATARALVRLFEKAFKISARKIRCTSVDGYGLRAGVATDQVLRAEVLDAKLFVAILTPASLTSHYVLFELGARWGASKPLVPVLANGTSPRDLRAPLSGLHALDASAADHVRQLVEDIAEALGQRFEPMASFSDEVDAVVAQAKQ